MAFAGPVRQQQRALEREHSIYAFREQVDLVERARNDDLHAMSELSEAPRDGCRRARTVSAAAAALAQPETRTALANQGLDITGTGAEQARQRFAELDRFYSDFAAKFNIRAE